MRVLTVLLIAIIAGGALAQDQPLFNYNMDAFQLTQQYAALDQPPPEAEPSDISVKKVSAKKKPGKAMLLSAMMPGLGELYAGSKWKAALFFAVEVAAWTGTAVYHQKGNDKEDEFEAFADQNWNRDLYWSWLWNLESDTLGNWWLYYLDLLDYNGDPYNNLPFNLVSGFEDSMGFTHNLPQEKTQQYYEMIGKYMVQFGAGWSDAVTDTFDISAANIYYWPLGTTNNSEFYMNLRGESNDLLDLSTTFIQIVMLNHVFSALDAGFTVRLQNRRIETAMDIRPRRYKDETVAMGRITVNW